jgi:hypothetical protein
MKLHARHFYFQQDMCIYIHIYPSYVFFIRFSIFLSISLICIYLPTPLRRSKVNRWIAYIYNQGSSHQTSKNHTSSSTNCYLIAILYSTNPCGTPYFSSFFFSFHFSFYFTIRHIGVLPANMALSMEQRQNIHGYTHVSFLHLLSLSLHVT